MKVKLGDNHVCDWIKLKMDKCQFERREGSNGEGGVVLFGFDVFIWFICIMDGFFVRRCLSCFFFSAVDVREM